MDKLSALLEALDAKRRAASPGPWHAGYTGVYNSEGFSVNSYAYIAALPPEVVGAFIDCARVAMDHADCGADRTDSLRDALARLAARLGGKA